MSGKITLLVMLIAFLAQSVFSQQLTVSQTPGQGQFTSISAALEAAGRGYVIEILDTEVYEEQVTIDSTHHNLTLRSSNPTASNRPVIMWQDTENVHPRNEAESRNPATINFDENGALRVLRARGVTIDGIIVDGGGAAPFGYQGVWEGRHPLFHGNAALCLWIAGNTVVRNSDFRNAYFGIAIKDRNEGGIYGNSNPADINPENVIPLAHFGRTGDHLIENNRIHSNSWGIFMESVWDLGSTIRFNLIYNNYHQTSDIVSLVSGLPDGDNQAGGAFFTKDHLLSPLAIYNNTFHNNYLTFAGHWRPGAHHLVFNNIYSRPMHYWADGYGGDFTNPFHALDPAFENRMKHSVYSTMIGEPEIGSRHIQIPQSCRQLGEEMDGYTQVRIMNGMDNVERGTEVTVECSDGSEMQVSAPDFIEPGARIVPRTAGGPFPSSANNRWIEMEDYFLSLDPDDPQFLTPDWDDPVVAQYIVEQGWPEANIRKSDGTPVDIGAIQSSPRQSNIARIRPSGPVRVDDDNTAILQFMLDVDDPSQFANPRIGYIRFLNDVEFDDDAFGGNATAISQADITTVDVPDGDIRIDRNNTITIRNVASPGEYAFFELVIEADGPNGTVTTDVGFLPYRELDYMITVDVLDGSGEITDTVVAGEQVQIRLTAQSADGERFREDLTEVDLGLISGNTIFRHPGDNSMPVEEVRVPGMPSGMFTVSNATFTVSGSELIQASAVWDHPTQEGAFVLFYGVTDLVVLPGEPDQISFEAPAPGTADIIRPGEPYDVRVRVRDRFFNPVNVEAPVSIQSLDPQIGDLEAPTTTTTNDTGAAFFTAMVTNGALNDSLKMRATLTTNNATGDGTLIVGRASDRIWIFYGDTLGYDESAEVRAEVSERVPVVIRALRGDTILEFRDTELELIPDPGVIVFDSPDASTPTNTVSLENGEVRVWITGTSVVDNATLAVRPTVDNTLIMNFRENIFFTQSATAIDRGVVYADNGDGRVNRMEVYYIREVEQMPDSIALSWPAANTNRRVAGQDNITLNPDDPRHLTVIFNEPFPERITSFTGERNLGVHYYRSKDPLIDPPLVEEISFNVVDSVGPMIKTGLVHERLNPGVDTLLLTFSERVSLSSLEGQSLTLIKADNDEISLTVLSVIPQGDIFKLVVRDEGENAPKEGDLLRFAGDVEDSRGVPIHPENEPIVLGLRPVPPVIQSAFYYDSNANGIVDRAALHFDKNVVLDQMTAEFSWVQSTKTGLLDHSRFSFGEDSSIVLVNLNGAFNKELDDVTSGLMEVTLNFLGFEDGVNATVRDRAAPVIKSATYKIGDFIENDNSFAQDTLLVVFSEPIEVPSHNEPFSFITEENGVSTEYLLELRFFRQRGDEYVFVVESEDAFPNVGDLIYINPVASVGDLEGNEQENPNNKRVELQIVSEIHFSADVGPSPYAWGSSVVLPQGAGEFRGILFRADFRSRISDANFSVDLTVYDYNGNVVVKESMEEWDSGTFFTYKWEHPISNRSGRHVSEGTYLAHFRAHYTQDGARRTDSEKKLFSIIKN
ncbi:hypothetical protein QA601_02685 [Chitinispirillales bacterium ANBcel5]|uniref:hypothetical protein n=1 Tax=Cellulosispirillum alkaliphilum TaxID=3039283 RepID=UPI002A503BA7|nr:hypothetical protein [Chitinispirillales bacterium ANBcel5]